MAHCFHGSYRWWKDKAGNRFKSCRLCEKIIVRAGKHKVYLDTIVDKLVSGEGEDLPDLKLDSDPGGDSDSDLRSRWSFQLPLFDEP